MVYHYTNFIYETNFWWMRRVRPVWVGMAVAFGYFVFDRYFFFGKNAVLNERKESKETWEKRAQQNKRDWGFNVKYKPTLERSRKKLILETLGDKYDSPVPYADANTHDTRSLEEILEQQNSY